MGIMYKLMKHRNLTMDLNKAPSKTNMKSDRYRFITIEGNIIEGPLSTATDLPQDDLTTNMDSNKDKHFTAEHIIQLCKFLAEKSKRNKNLYKQQQSPKKLTKTKQSEFPFQPVEYDDNDDEVKFYQNEALPLLNKQRLEMQRKNYAEDENNKGDEFEEQKAAVVLSTRLSPDINSLNISLNTTTATSCALQHHQQQEQQQQQQQQPHQQYFYDYQRQHQLQPQPPQNQGKRDILLKIRRQIFERKRLRENGALEPQALNNSQVWRPW